MKWTVMLSALLVMVLVTVPAYSTFSMLDACARRGDEIMRDADPLDRAPPASVAAAITAHVPMEELPGMLSTVLLDRYQCRGGPAWNGTEWLIDKPALASRLRRSFRSEGLIALFACSAEMGKGDVGLSRGARRVYRKEITALDVGALDCLVRRALGKPSSWREDMSVPICPVEGGPPGFTVYDHVVRP